MVLSIPGKAESPFLMLHLPELLERFSLSYERDDTCIEYFLYSREKLKEISRTLIVSHEIFSGSLHVSKFYPELYKELNCRYLSAACFYMMAHHAVNMFHLSDNCCVNLETEADVFQTFYSRLDDFDFKVKYNRPCNRLCLTGRYHKIPFGTDMVTHHLT